MVKIRLSSIRKVRNLSLSLLLTLICTGLTLAAKAQTIDTGNSTGWLVIGSDGKHYQDSLSESLSPDRGKKTLEWRVSRGLKAMALAKAVPISNLKSVEFDIWSKNNTLTAVQIEDQDRARFHAPIILTGGKWTHVMLTHRDFKINDDSPVKKTAVQPEQLGNILSFVELGRLLNAKEAKEANILRLDNLRLVRGSEPKTVSAPSVVTKPETITENLTIDRPLEIRQGGKLTIAAKQVTLRAPITIDGGTLALNGARVRAEGRMPHDLAIKLKRGGKLTMTDSVWLSSYMTSLNLESASAAEFNNVRFSGSGFTVELKPGNKIDLHKVEDLGEFVIAPGAKISATDCRGLLFWLIFTKENPAAIVLPQESAVKNWLAPAAAKFAIQIRQSSNIMWGLVVDSGAQVRLNKTNLRAVGVLFTQPGRYEVSGIKNKSIQAFPTSLSDRSVDLGGSSVQSWNFYPSSKTHLKLSQSIFGELIAFGDGEATINDSTCDGSGGYIGAHDSSKVKLVNTLLQCPVVSFEQAQILLQSCKMKSTINASGKSKIEVLGGTMAEAPQKFDQAEVEVKR
jgi:hypothetical protein